MLFVFTFIDWMLASRFVRFSWFSVFVDLWRCWSVSFDQFRVSFWSFEFDDVEDVGILLEFYELSWTSQFYWLLKNSMKKKLISKNLIYKSTFSKAHLKKLISKSSKFQKNQAKPKRINKIILTFFIYS